MSSSSGVFLVCNRSAKGERAARDIYRQIALSIDAGGRRRVAIGARRRPRSGNIEGDLPNIASRVNYEVVFQLLPAAVVDRINAWIDILKPDPGVVGHIGVPLFRIISDQVIGRGRQGLEANNLRLGISSFELHAQVGGAVLSTLAVCGVLSAKMASFPER